jgi:hypothetical protein
MNLNEQINRINELMVKSEEDGQTPLEKNLATKPELIPLYKEIEQVLGDKFTDNHFKQEITYSGPIKDVSNGLLPDTLNQFKLMSKEIPGIAIRDRSFRTYEDQKNTFIKYANKYGGTISGGLKQAALPGFSQHHTGNAIDVKNYSLLKPNILKKYGFTVSYPVQTSFRIAEPWHIYYNGNVG